MTKMTAAEMKSEKQAFPTIRRDLLDRLSDKAEEMTRPISASDLAKTAKKREWAA